MRFYRIAEISPNKFVPQTCTIFDMIFTLGICWYGIDRYSNYTWASKEYQSEHCSLPTLEEAKQVVLRYKKSKTKTVKYHKA